MRGEIGDPEEVQTASGVVISLAAAAAEGTEALLAGAREGTAVQVPVPAAAVGPPAWDLAAEVGVPAAEVVAAEGEDVDESNKLQS